MCLAVLSHWNCNQTGPMGLGLESSPFGVGWLSLSGTRSTSTEPLTATEAPAGATGVDFFFRKNRS
jgi:hypothetical protein